MPARITTINELQQYLAGVVGRAEHHAPTVQTIVFALAGALICFKDADAPIEIFTRNGEAKNVLWACFGGQRYAFTYNHEDGTVAIKEGTTHGTPVATFNNNSTLTEVVRILQGLR
jgi:hypothetical protein